MLALQGSLRLSSSITAPSATRPPLLLRLSPQVLSQLTDPAASQTVQLDDRPDGMRLVIQDLSADGSGLSLPLERSSENGTNVLYISSQAGELSCLGRVKEKLSISGQQHDLADSGARLRERTAELERERLSRHSIALDAEPKSNGKSSSVAKRAISPAPARARSPAPNGNSPKPRQPSKLGPGPITVSKPSQSGSSSTSPQSSGSSANESTSTAATSASVAPSIPAPTNGSEKKRKDASVSPNPPTKRIKTELSPPEQAAVASRRMAGDSPAGGPRAMAKTSGGARLSKPLKRSPPMPATAVLPKIATTTPPSVEQATAPATEESERPKKKKKPQPTRRPKVNIQYSTTEEDEPAPRGRSVESKSLTAPANGRPRTLSPSPVAQHTAQRPLISSQADYTRILADYEQRHIQFDLVRRQLLQQRESLQKAIALQRRGQPTESITCDPEALNVEVRKARQMREELVQLKSALTAYVARSS